MKFLILFLSLTTLAVTGFAQKYPCLPAEIKEGTIASADVDSGKVTMKAKQVTVGQTLKKLRAKCRKGKLVDGNRRAIRFYNLQGCWGNPPSDYQEILEQQKIEIEKLRKKYTVIEMTCNPNGVMVY